MSAASVCYRVAIAVLVVIPCCRLIYNEYCKRKEEASTSVANDYQLWLDRWSMLAMILLLFSFPMRPLDEIFILCKYCQVISDAIWLGSKVTITFYQIARLQYCFAQDQVHSKYGYSKIWFLLLYLIGILFSFILIIEAIRFLFFREYHHDPNFGCVGEESWIGKLLYSVSFGCYAIWDWTVFICYIFKICQFYNKKQNVEESISMRIKFVVYKIAFLTLILELMSAITLSIYNTIFSMTIYWIFRLVLHTILTLENLVSVYMVYLMIDHNNEEYIKFVKMLDRMGMFFCCRSFVDISLSMDVESQLSKHVSDQKEQNEIKVVEMTVDTKSDINIPEPLPINYGTSGASPI